MSENRAIQAGQKQGDEFLQFKQMTQPVVSITMDFEKPAVNFASNKIRFYSITIKCNTVTLYLTRLILNSQLSILRFSK